MNPKAQDKRTLTVRIIIFSVIMIVIIVLMRVVVGATAITTQYNSFAQCLTQKDVKFFGAFWCPHCQAQKREFGGAVKFLPYVECSTPDGKGETQVCIDNKITGYPTWQFADGTRLAGVQDLSTLAQKSGCALPTASQAENDAISTGGESSAVTQ